MTDTSSHLPSFLEDYGLQQVDHPVFVWDGDAEGFAWANGAGLDQWGALSLQSFRASRLDRAMPAMIRLRELSKTALPSEGIFQTLMFWTPRGACRLDCRCRPIDLGDGGHGLILEASSVVNDGASSRSSVQGAQGETAGNGRTPYLPSDADRGTLSQVNGTRGKQVSGFLNGAVVAEQSRNLPAPSEADREAMAEIARMLGRPGTPQDRSSSDVDAPGVDCPTAPPLPQQKPVGATGDRLRGDMPEEETASPAAVSTQPGKPLSADDFDNLNHELRTPLNSIIGFAEMMHSEQLGPIGNTRYKEYVGDILDSAHHALGLINDLLDASRVRAGHITVAREDINVPELLDRTIALMQPQAQKAMVTLVPGYPETMPTLGADSRAMRQILLNLLSNAIKFTGAGGRVFVTAQRGTGGTMTIAVRDTGRGMTEAQLERAMTQWGQVEASSANETAGSGLGLPLVKTLTEAQGGTLRMRSTPGEGTRAEVVFPRATPDAEDDPEPA